MNDNQRGLIEDSIRQIESRAGIVWTAEFLEDYAAALRALLDENAALKAKFEGLNDAVEEACGELPEGWMVLIYLERGAGWVDLSDPDGDCIEVHEDETSISDLVREAVRRAKEGR